MLTFAYGMHVTSPSLKCMIKAGCSVHSESLLGGRAWSPVPATSQSSLIKMSCKYSNETTTWHERWYFLKQLPDRIIRDIGFVILSPPILQDSQELPTVSPDVYGGGIKTWLDSATWLATLNIDQVNQWFGAKKNKGRLGEHFAFCVEYILLFSPFSHARNLMTFKQVTSRTGEPASQPPEVDIVVEKDGILINSNSGKTGDPVGPMEGVTELMGQCEGEACKPRKLEIIQGNTPTVIYEPSQSKIEKIGKRKKKLLRKMQRLRDGNGVTHTIGEFDFLFEEAIEQDEICRMTRTQRDGEVRVNHWEVSVKFLLYAGPWERFGFETPNHAGWTCLNQDCREEMGCQADTEFQYTDVSKKSGCHGNMFLGCFLGPHAGENLYNRKTRLINQLGLSQNVHAASLLWECFGLRPNEKVISSFSANHSRDHMSGSLCTSGVCTDEAIEQQHSEVLRIFPRAFLKGYLFYEYELWCQLYPGKAMGQQVNCHLEILNRDSDLRSEAKVNPEHWMGWWTRAHNFANFARLPVHEHSKWYIVPKLEWLSPVVIDGEDEMRGQQVLSLDEFLIVAEKVAEEAEKTNISRKRRFMIAEVLWESLDAAYCAFDQNTLRQEGTGSSKGRGRWTEVSRGFIVEDTWPDSRLYRPHGYRLSSLP